MKLLLALALALSAVITLTPTSADAGDLPPVVWTSMIDKTVKVVLDNGLEVTGTLAGYDATAAVLVKADGSVVTIDPSEAASIKVVGSAAPESAAPAKSGGVAAPPVGDLAPALPAGAVPIGPHELSALIRHSTQFKQRVDASGYSPETKKRLKSLQRGWKQMDAVSDAFTLGGGGLALAGIFPLVFGATSIDDDDGIVPEYEAPAVAAAGGAMVGTGLALMLGPGLGFASAGGSKYRAIESILVGPPTAWRLAPPRIQVAFSPGSGFISASWHL